MKPISEFAAFWQQLGRLVLAHLANKSHVEIVITLRDGGVQIVRANQSFQPDGLPKV